jgi:uroporphyrinogen-III synthase
VKIFGLEPAADLLRTTVVAAIGPVTADVAKQYGIDVAIVPAEATIPALAQAIVKYFTL